MTMAFARDDRIRIHVQIDERAAGFMALGLGLASGRPAVVVTTSGTAAVELHPSVVEAEYADVPLLAVTTDRPPELHGVGAPQTIEQEGLFGLPTVSPGVPRPDAAASWRSLAARAVLDAARGPVHLNLAFTEPLLADPGELPPALTNEPPAVAAPPATVVDALAGKRVVVVAGRGADPSLVTPVAQEMGWPVFADPLSGCPGITSFDLLARRDPESPDAVVWWGARPASKVLGAWLRDVELQVVVASRADPDRRATLFVDGLAAPGAPAPSDWLPTWQERDEKVQALLDERLTGLTDPAIARTIVQAMDDAQALVVASSMPIRDVEWFGGPSRARVLANRGANGIDGVVSTAVGVALTGVPTVALVGDLAFLHDTNALLGQRDVSLTVVVVDNDGGAIFSFLPQKGQLPDEDFERLFGTPHGLDLVEVARAHGAEAIEAETLDDIRSAVQGRTDGIRVVVAKTDRAENVEAHEAIYEAVARALTD
jgi:2-succinyl-5-enolpyruvyl-6-hydroxy-3-cyclohexene-1-carboxylate synthase